jgi:NtrC-family two-component system sensor histidine kinase KinB
MIGISGGSKTVFKSYIFLGAVVIALVSFIYTQSIIRRLEDASKTITRIYAEFYAKIGSPGAEMSSVETEIIFEEVIRKITIPVVFTDQRGVPTTWRNIGIEPDEIAREELENPDPLNPSKALDKLYRIITKLDSENEPIALVSGRKVYAYLHYGESRAVRELRWAPLVQLVVVALFVIVGFLGFRAIRVAEENLIWAGMAKETAHQLGTPISSLMGWVEYLKGSEGRKPAGEVVPEMEKDLNRLDAVASRFNRVGSPPKFQKVDLGLLLSETADYFRTRLPKHEKKIEIREDYGSLPLMYIDRELFSWAVENLIRNSLDALTESSGVIRVRAATSGSGRFVEIRVEDTGRGMTRDEKRRAFLPGYTTKKFGWGLGLPLARRIVEKYHSGQLLIEASQPGKGTSFLIRMHTRGG